MNCPVARPTSPRDTRLMIQTLGEMLDVRACYRVGKSFHLDLPDGWSLAITPETAGRVRMQACHRRRVVDTLFAFVHDTPRVVGLALELRAHALSEAT